MSATIERWGWHLLHAAVPWVMLVALVRWAVLFIGDPRLDHMAFPAAASGLSLVVSALTKLREASALTPTTQPADADAVPQEGA